MRVFGCTTLTPNPKVNGTVNVVNNAQINAAGGDGIFAFNFGNGNVSVTSNGPITVTGATAQNGIEAFSAEINNISVSHRGQCDHQQWERYPDDQRRDRDDDDQCARRHHPRRDQRRQRGISQRRHPDQQLGDDPEPVRSAGQLGGRDIGQPATRP